LAYAAAQLTHVSLVIWLFHISARPPLSGKLFAFFTIGIVWTYLLAALSFVGFADALGRRAWRTLRVTGLMISAKDTCYRRERWVTPDGHTILAPLPDGIEGHFGPELRRFVLMQYHQGQSTLPRLAALLRSLGVAISKRQLQRLLL
jgi:hypothetical protein